MNGTALVGIDVIPVLDEQCEDLEEDSHVHELRVHLEETLFLGVDGAESGDLHAKLDFVPIEVLERVQENHIDGVLFSL